MNTSVSKYLLSLLMVVAFGCKKEIIDQYNLQPVRADNGQGEKTTLKSDEQLISIMHTDLFGSAITSNQLKVLFKAYSSFGDKNLIIDEITRKFLADPSVVLPQDTYMHSNTDKFIREMYARFFIRQPNEMEVWYLKKVIGENPDLGVEAVVYAMLTSDEYKYF